MSWLFSQALVEAFSADTCSDGEQSAQLNVMPTQHKFWRNDKTMEFSRLSQFGLTCAVLTEDHGAELLTWFLEGSPARTLVPQGKGLALTGNGPGYGESSRGSFARFDLAQSTWKTAQYSLLGGLDEFSETWPRWGSMRNGESYLRPIPELTMSAGESGFWPTQCADDTSDRKLPDSMHITASGLPKYVAANGQKSMMRLSQAVKLYPTPCARDYRGVGRSRLERTGSKAGESLPQIVGGLLNPEWTEWLMGWPIGWTELKPLATDKFREWQQQHSIFSHNDSRKAA